MKVTEQDLRERYEALETEQLLELQAQGTLTETATRALEQVDGLPRGQSIGKRAVNIAVIDRRTHKPCTYVQSFLRNFLLALLGIFDWIFIFGRRRQRLGDWAANTIVVRVR